MTTAANRRWRAVLARVAALGLLLFAAVGCDDCDSASRFTNANGLTVLIVCGGFVVITPNPTPTPSPTPRRF